MPVGNSTMLTTIPTGSTRRIYLLRWSSWSSVRTPSRLEEHHAADRHEHHSEDYPEGSGKQCRPASHHRPMKIPSATSPLWSSGTGGLGRSRPMPPFRAVTPIMTLLTANAAYSSTAIKGLITGILTDPTPSSSRPTRHAPGEVMTNAPGSRANR